MKKKKVCFKIKGKKICLDTLDYSSFLGRGTGLTYTRRKKARALLFEFKKPSRDALTGLFVFFPFYVIWLDEKNNVLEWRRVKPWTFHVNIRNKFSKVVEIPETDLYRREIETLVGKRKI